MQRGKVLQALARSGPTRDTELARRDDQIRASQPVQTGPQQQQQQQHQQQDQNLQQLDQPCQGQRQHESNSRVSARGGATRGGLVARQLASQLESIHIQQSEASQTEPQAATPADSGASSEDLPNSADTDTDADADSSSRSRRDSTGSRSSSVSQHFASVEQADERVIKTLLPKNAATSGEQVQLSLNYMTFNTDQSTRIEEYHVGFNPNIESSRLRASLLRTEPARAVIGDVFHWTGTNLYLPVKLAQTSYQIGTTHPVTGQPVSIRINYVKTPPDEELLPFYNSLMHKVLTRLRYVIFNRQHYSPQLKISIDQYKLELWPGWITAIQRLDGGLKLSIDSSFKVVRQETVRDIMKAIRDRARGASIKEAFEAELIGAVIMTKYNNKAYRIDGIDTTKKPSDTFLMDREGGREISYIDYMKEHWNAQINDPHQPLIIHHPKPKKGMTTHETVYLIPELCVATGLTDEMRANFSLMKSVGDHTRLPPDAREAKLAEFLRELSTDQRAKSVLDEWNLSVRPTLDIVPGRRLETETITFGQGRQTKVQDNVDWTRAATTGPVFRSVDITKWVIIHTERDNPIAEDLMAHIREVSKALNMRFTAPRIIKLPNDSSTTYVNCGRREVNQDDQMVVILTPGKSQREDRYSALKRLFSCEKGVPCQFIRCGTISNPKRVKAICQKIVIQILSKVGGQPWAMRFPMKSFMVVGIDTFHDSIDRKRSCVGFVASMNEFTSAWWSHTFFQHSLEEIGHKVSTCLIKALRRFHNLNKFLPAKIIVYRDGVGDGQLDAVIRFEIAQAINAINSYIRDEHSEVTVPQISYLIVQKRINAKLSLRSCGRIMNPLPGTYLDHSITHPEYNDFYLVSQHVNQGTVSPTKYVLITETGNLKLDHHQKMAYKMTHMYYNWTGTIRVPAPCQYAHKMAYMAGENIKQQVAECLEDKLYYL